VSHNTSLTEQTTRRACLSYVLHTGWSATKLSCPTHLIRPHSPSMQPSRSSRKHACSTAPLSGPAKTEPNACKPCTYCLPSTCNVPGPGLLPTFSSMHQDLTSRPATTAGLCCKSELRQRRRGHLNGTATNQIVSIRLEKLMAKHHMQQTLMTSVRVTHGQAWRLLCQSSLKP
jgi:hypothetical protein